MSWQIAIGETVSSTVTVATQLLVFPLTSVTVSVTGLAPTPEHVNSLGVTYIVSMAQLSALPASTSAGRIPTCPRASK